MQKEDLNPIEILQFTGLMFNLLQPRFILDGTIDEHIRSYTKKSLAEVIKIRDDLYVVDLVTVVWNFAQVASLKDIAIETFHEAGFKLYKWHSNDGTFEEKKPGENALERKNW